MFRTIKWNYTLILSDTYCNVYIHLPLSPKLHENNISLVFVYILTDYLKTCRNLLNINKTFEYSFSEEKSFQSRLSVFILNLYCLKEWSVPIWSNFSYLSVSNWYLSFLEFNTAIFNINLNTIFISNCTLYLKKRNCSYSKRYAVIIVIFYNFHYFIKNRARWFIWSILPVEKNAFCANLPETSSHTFLRDSANYATETAS